MSKKAEYPEGKGKVRALSGLTKTYFKSPFSGLSRKGVYSVPLLLGYANVMSYLLAS